MEWRRATILTLALAASLVGADAVGAQEQGSKRPQGAPELQRDLARIELLVEVDRDLEGALARLREVRAAADALGDAELIAMAARLQALALLELGRPDEARHVLRALPEEVSALKQVAQVRARLETQAGAVPDDIRRAVRGGIVGGQPALVLEIGGRAAPVLEQMVLESPEELPAPAARDPLVLLLEVAELRGAAFVLAHLDAGGFLWKKRVLRAMREAQVLNDEGTWSGAERAPKTLLEPQWLPVLERLLADPLVRREALPLVGEIALRDALTPELAQALARTVQSADPDTLRDLAQLLEPTWRHETAVPVLEAALAHPDAHLRRMAAWRLASFPRSEALRAAADHEDSEIRAALATSMSQRLVEPGRFGPNEGGPGAVMVRGELLPGDADLLVRLARDSHPAVVHAAAKAIRRAAAPRLPLEVYLHLARHPGEDVRVLAGRVEAAPPEELDAILQVLATDEVELVRHVVHERLEELAKSGADLLPYFGAFTAALAEPDAVRRYGELRSAVDRALRQPDVVRAFARWALEGVDLERLRMLVDRAPSDRDEAVGLGVLEAELLEPMLRRAGEDPELLEQVWKHLARARDGAAAARAILGDGQAPRAARAVAAAVLAEGGERELSKPLRSLLALRSWSQEPPLQVERDALRHVTARGLDEAALVALAGDQEVRLEPLRAMLGGNNVDTKPGVARPLLLRWSLDELGMDLGREALWNLHGPVPDALAARWVDALDTGWAVPVLQAMGRSRHPAFVDPLGAILTRGNAPPSVQKLAAEALAGYLDERAAELLLAGAAATTSAEVREAAFAGLEAIRRFQEERARWERRAGDRLERDQAVEQLVDLLRDPAPAVRAQAARSLATLEAVEQLPRLVVLLKDPDPQVREAAQQALDALNRREDR